MEAPTWLSVLPPILAITVAIATKQVLISLFVGIWLGWTILAGGNPLVGLQDAIAACIDTFRDAGNTRVVAFISLTGALLAFTQRSGGVEGFIRWVERRGFARTRRRAQLMTWFLGVAIFVESSITCLVTGTFARPLFDRLALPREKLAYICDSTSAPVCVLVPLNAWGAFIITLLTAQQVEQPLKLMLAAIPLNFYALLSVLYVLFIALTDRDWGPMARAERRARETGQVLRPGAEALVGADVLELGSKEGVTPRALNMAVPLLAMIGMMPIGLLITGKGDLTAGSGSTSVLWAVLAGTAVAAAMYAVQRLFSLRELTELFSKGISGLMPLALLMVLAFAIGATCKKLETGAYVAGVAQGLLSPEWVPATIFIVAAFIAFSTGTSWGTFAIMVPIGVPMVKLIGAHPALTVAAITGGGVFGDHCSPISDTTIIASMASGCDHIDHVRTQLPYALLAAAASVVLFVGAGFLLG